MNGKKITTPATPLPRGEIVCTGCQERFWDASDFGIHRHRCGMNISFTHNDANQSNNIPLNSFPIVNNYSNNTQQASIPQKMNSFNTPEAVITHFPFLKNPAFGKLMENEKRERTQLTAKLAGDGTNNLLKINSTGMNIVSPYFLPSPNQLNKIQANLLQDEGALKQVQQLYMSGSSDVTSKSPTQPQLNKLKFTMMRIQEINQDYNHFDHPTVLYISLILQELATSIKTAISDELKIIIYNYFMKLKPYCNFGDMFSDDGTVANRCQAYDHLRIASRQSSLVHALLKGCAESVRNHFKYPPMKTQLLNWVMEHRNMCVNRKKFSSGLNDFTHELFTQAWKPIMNFGRNRTNHGSNNFVSGTSYMPQISVKRKQDQEGAVSLLEMKTGNYASNTTVPMTPWKSNALEEELSLTKSIPGENKIVIQQQPLVDCIVKAKHKTLTERMVSPPPVKVMKTINSSNNQERVETATIDGNKQLDEVNARNQKPSHRHVNNISSTVINKNTPVRNITKQYNKKFKQTI